MDKQIQQLIQLMKQSKNTVVVTGAGISTEAGIPDFRGDKGIYRQMGEDRVMRVINIDFFRRHTGEFYDFYRKYFTFPDVEPSKAHYMLAELEKKGVISAIVTQNIDNLHQQAGSKNVIPVHGNAAQFVCTRRSCRKTYSHTIMDQYPEGVPRCTECDGVLKPDVILFGEQIQNYAPARESILQAHLVIVIGSSLTVYPLAGFVREFCTFTQDLVIINKGRTQMDHAALLKIDTGTTGNVLEQVNKAF